ERDDMIKLREVSLRKGEEDLTSRETAWQKLREFWQSEKLQAERVIRDLLRQLEEKEAGMPNSDRAGDFPLHEAAD
ncbi:MAG: hypothetical protein KDA68_10310, partial [Planctomycetaceae bacterium]|nr:hypothetical protein [Planctomycetaceae bacterium]